jgi:hypothetical protein
MLTAEPDGLLLHAMTSMATLFRTLSACSQLQSLTPFLSFGGDQRAVGIGDWPYGPHHVGFAGLTEGVLAVGAGRPPFGRGGEEGGCFVRGGKRNDHWSDKMSEVTGLLDCQRAGSDGPNGRHRAGRFWRSSRRGPGDAFRNVSGMARRCAARLRYSFATRTPCATGCAES